MVMMMMMTMKNEYDTVIIPVFVGKIFNHISLEYGMVLYCTVSYA